ncbi:MAG: phosphatase PAP2 family protein [Pseudomonadaceae bacterium]|nr:phosphatase PAP2 family protein [Pseudomonadaceae bacterium]
MPQQRILTTLTILLFTIGLAGCTSITPGETQQEIPEIAPGVLMGYTPMDDPLLSKAFVSPAPAPGSARAVMDETVAQEMLLLRGTPRWTLATRDAHLRFPDAANTFTCALGMPITEADTPELYMLLRRTLADLGLAAYSAKNAYQRERPFMINKQPICTPEEETMLRADGSYPSGHTAIGWGWALILSELAPDRAEALLSRGRAYGESRNVCNVHWRSDVDAGRLVGAAAVARLHTNEAFLTALSAARSEIANLKEQDPVPAIDCALEVQVLGPFE